jgi:hypothetical protein
VAGWITVVDWSNVVDTVVGWRTVAGGCEAVVVVVVVNNTVPDWMTVMVLNWVADWRTVEVISSLWTRVVSWTRVVGWIKVVGWKRVLSWIRVVGWIKVLYWVVTWVKVAVLRLTSVTVLSVRTKLACHLVSVTVVVALLQTGGIGGI